MRRYFAHPESESFWATDDLSEEADDGMLVEIDRDEYIAGILAQFHARARTGPVRVVAFGGRDFADRAAVYSALDDFHLDVGVSCLVEGEANGADMLAKRWAEQRGVPVDPFPADWERLFNDAGPARNQQMIDDGRPDCGIAFRGDRGTADMTSRMELAGLPVFAII